MNSASLSKLLFAGVAAGIALSCGIVVATSLSSSNSFTVSDTKTDRLNIVSAADPKSDRTRAPSIGEQVTRGEKTDALEITLAILRGSDLETSDPLPFAVPQDQPAEPVEDYAFVPEAEQPADQPETVVSVPEEPVTQERTEDVASAPDATEPAAQPESIASVGEEATAEEQPEAVASVPEDVIPAPATVPRTETRTANKPVRVVTRPTGPINIIPTPAPVENTPVAAPSTSTNFTTEPHSRATDTGVQTDLLR